MARYGRRSRSRGYDSGWAPYVPVAERQYQASRLVAKLRKQGRAVYPVEIAGRKIATTFWGKSWCENLESYSDYANRLPRGRTYVRNGSVIDLQITPGKVTALVSGSTIYDVTIAITPLPETRWGRLVEDCAGQIDSAVELLQGKLSRGVMDTLCRKPTGLFPAPPEISLDCSCPDWASMCKHVAAALYGVGARLDEQPELLFRLRQVDESDLLRSAGTAAAGGLGELDTGELGGDDELAALFGIDIDEGADIPAPPAKKQRKPARKAKSETRPALDLRAGARVAARALTPLGISHATLQKWLRKGVLVHSGDRGVYLATDTSAAAVRQHLGTDAATITGRELRARGIPSHTVQYWRRKGVLGEAVGRGEYRTTPALTGKIAAYLGRLSGARGRG